MRPRASLAGLLLLSAGCARACARPEPLRVPDAGEALEEASVEPSAYAPSRCTLQAASVSLGDAAVEVGVAARTADGLAVGVRAGDEARVALVRADLGAVQSVNLGLLAADAPPPRPLVLGGDDVYAAFYGQPSGRRTPGSRAVVLSRVDPKAGAAVRVVELPPEAPDDSLAMDAALLAGGVAPRGAVVWDEPAGGKVASAVRMATFAAGKASPPVTLSPPDTDADRPRIVARAAGGYWVVWVAHRALPASDAAALPEGPGEDVGFEWLEVLAVGPDGTPYGAPQRLTAEQGRAGVFDLTPAAGPDAGASAGDFDLFARDAEDTGAQGSGKLLLASVHGGHAAPARVLLDGGVGRGAPVGARAGATAAVVFEDPSGAAVFLPLQPSGGLPSLEPELDPYEVLAPLGADAGALRVVVAREASAELRLARCIPD